MTIGNRGVRPEVDTVEDMEQAERKTNGLIAHEITVGRTIRTGITIEMVPAREDGNLIEDREDESDSS